MSMEESFNKAVLNNNMREFWSDTLFAMSPEKQEEVAQRRYREAFCEFKRIMSSSKNKGDVSYQSWAINKALGLSYKANSRIRTKRAR